MFRSHIDGSTLTLSPERAVRDPGGAGQRRGHGAGPRRGAARPTPRLVRDACERTVRWAERCQQAARRPDQACSPSSRADWTPSCGDGVPSSWSSWIFRATPSAG